MKIVIAVLTFLCYTSQIQAQQITEQFIDSLLHEIPKAANDTIKLRLYKTIAEKCLTSIPQEALFYADAGLIHAKKMKWPKGVAVFNDIIGQYYSNKGKGDSAIIFYEIAYQIDIKNGLNYNAASTLNNIGAVYQNQAKYQKAIAKFTEALQLAEAEKNVYLTAICNQNIALIYREQGDFVKAIAIYKKVIILHQKDENLDGVASAYSSIAGTYVQMKDTVNANFYFTKSIEVFKKTENFLELATAYTEASILEKNIVKRIEIKLKAQKIWNEYNPNHLTSSANLSNLGLEYFTLVKHNLYNKVESSPYIPATKEQILQKAKQYYTLALQISEEQNFVSNIASQSELLAELEAFMGNYKGAYEHYRTYSTLTDSIFSQENKNQIATIIGQREVLLKNKEIELNMQAIAIQRKQKIALGIGLVLIAFIGFLFFNQSKTRKRANTQLSKLNTQLDEANKLKAKFFAILSHDLRSPISNLINFLHLQKNVPEALDPEKYEVYQNKISSSAEELLENMEAMLIWSKGQMQEFKPAIETVFIDTLFAHLKSNFSNYSQIEFQFINPLNLRLESDSNFLQTIMQNLTNNAVKAMDANKHTKIVWEAQKLPNGKIQLSITDTGKGLSKQQIDDLLSNENITSKKNGLGFFIVKDLAKAIGFTISIVSVEGKETTIALTASQ